MKQFISLSKYTGVLLITMSIVLFWSCEDEAEVGDEKHPEELVGTWYFTDGEFDIEITTNSDQTMVNQFSEGIGSIDVSGEVTATLTYMIMMVEEDDGFVGIMVLNQSPYTVSLGEQDSPFYAFAIYPPEDYVSAMFMVYESEYNYTYYTTDTIEFFYDTSTYTLTINSTDFMELDMSTYEIDSSSVVTISGTLQNQTTNIPANSPTQVSFVGDLTDYFSEFTVSLNTDGSWLRTMVMEFEGETETETGVGSWEVDDDQLIIIEEYEEDGETEVDTVELDFTLSDNTLTIIMGEDWCEDDEDYSVEECLEEAEGDFGLESGSLTDIVRVWIMNFSQTAPTTKIVAKSSLRHLLQSKMPQHKRVVRHYPFR